MNKSVLRLYRRLHRSFSTAEAISSSTVKEGEVSKEVAGPLIRDERYQIRTGAVLVRNPITLQPLNEFEKAYEEYRLEVSRDIARGKFEIPSTHNEELKKASNELYQFEYSLPQEFVEAEKDEKSLMRRLDRKLYFVVQDGLCKWKFPEFEYRGNGEALHRWSAKGMKLLLGKECEIYQVGRAPIAYHKEHMSDRVAPPFGYKTFFFKSQLVRGALHFRKHINAHTWAWLTSEELRERLPADYYESIRRVLSY